jgi:hypothetical protein
MGSAVSSTDDGNHFAVTTNNSSEILVYKKNGNHTFNRVG